MRNHLTRKPPRRTKSFDDVNSVSSEELESDSKQLADYIYRNVVGGETVFDGPYGPRGIIYCDYIASGKPLKFIERFISKEILPFYGNTHTTTSISSLRTTLMREESRKILKKAFNVIPEEDVLIFAGSGCTGAVNKLVGAVGLSHGHSDEVKKSVVIFVSLQEHHSNLLPWRESGAEVITIEETPDGKVDLEDLEFKLRAEHDKKPKHRRTMIGCFTVASNVSGLMNDDVSITALLHKYGSLAFWDYAAAGPYVKIDMNPQVEGDTHGFCKKDAIYFSCHKFVGGPQTPGILVAKKKLFHQELPPNFPGGGTVLFVTDTEQRYVRDIEVKEEGGTPAIIESIRAGLVIQLKEKVGIEFITHRERDLVRRARKKLGPLKNLVFLGNGIFHDHAGTAAVVHLPILSFVVKAPPELGGYIHHNFICCLLNDLFGIQARGGCACAGPYAQKLLGMTHADTQAFVDLVEREEEEETEAKADNVSTCSCNDLDYHESGQVHAEFLKPGFSRLSLPWFAPDDVIDYVLDAIVFVAEEGWKFMVHYDVDLGNGEWKHVSHIRRDPSFSLENISYEKGFFEYRHHQAEKRLTEPILELKQNLLEAKNQLQHIYTSVKNLYIPDQTASFKGQYEQMRWSILPCEAQELIIARQERKVIRKKPLYPAFRPRSYPVARSHYHSDEDIGSLHGNVARVQNPLFLVPLKSESLTEEEKKNGFKKVPHKVPHKDSHHALKKFGKLWSKDKSSKSKSIETLAIRSTANDDELFDTGNVDMKASNWREDQVMSNFMNEYVTASRQKVQNAFYSSE